MSEVYMESAATNHNEDQLLKLKLHHLLPAQEHRINYIWIPLSGESFTEPIAEASCLFEPLLDLQDQDHSIPTALCTHSRLDKQEQAEAEEL